MRRNRTTATLRIHLDVSDPRFDRAMLELEKVRGYQAELEERVAELGRYVDELSKRRKS